MFSPIFTYLGVTLLAGCIKANVALCPSGSGASALYLQSNEQHNSVISIPIGENGRLHGGLTTPSGGMGGDSIDGMTNAPACPDALSSQGSIAVIDNVSSPGHFQTPRF